MAKLFLLPESPEIEPLIIHDATTVIGREPDCQIQIEEPNVSKYHALFVRTSDGYRVYDLYSANGTYLNDHRITVAVLRSNDHVRFGPASFRFESEIEPPLTQVTVPPAKVHLHPKQHLPAAPTATVPPKPSVATIITPPPAPTPVPAAAPTPAPAPTPVKQEPRVSIRIPESAKPAPAPIPVPPPVAPPPPPPPAIEQPPATSTTLGGPKPIAGERTLRPRLGGTGGGEIKLKLKK